VKPGLSVLENLGFAARVGGGDALAALEGVGLGGLAGMPARMLSAGQKRRVALARLAVLRASVWLLDEPTVGLDLEAVERFGRALRVFRAGGGLVVAATHVPLPLPGGVELQLGGLGPLAPAGVQGAEPLGLS
jgi:heme exporter protein A